MANLWRRFRDGRGGLFRSAAIVASGHVAGYALLLAAAPILSRLYSPAAFGVLSVFVALATTTATIATLRFDQAIPLPRSDRTAASLAALAGFFTVAVCGVLIAVAATWGAPINRSIRHWPLPPDCLYLLAAGVAAIAVFQITTAWLVRTQQFALLARTRVVYVVAALATQLAVPLVLLPGAVGLVSGQIVGFALAGALVARKMRSPAEGLSFRLTHRMQQVAHRYRNYPLFDVWAAIAQNLGAFGPPALLAVLFGAEVAGWFVLAHRLLWTPLGMFSNSLSRVYFSEAARIGAGDPAALRLLFRQTLARVLLLVVPPVAVAAVVAPLCFGFVFGSDWHAAGLYFSLLGPLVIAHIAAYIVGPTLDVVGRQRSKLAREATCLALLASGILLPYAVGQSATVAVAAMSVCGTAGYVLAIAVAWSAVADGRDTESSRFARYKLQKAA